MEIKFSLKHRHYTVVDEHKRAWIVQLYPPLCTCTEKIGCVHIYAVEHFNGLDISTKYKYSKLTPLTQVIRNKNGGMSGRKKRGHEANSKEKSKEPIGHAEKDKKETKKLKLMMMMLTMKTMMMLITKKMMTMRILAVFFIT